jgi:Na+/H+-translocating membrane pyrophosphatase
MKRFQISESVCSLLVLVFLLVIFQFTHQQHYQYSKDPHTFKMKLVSGGGQTETANKYSKEPIVVQVYRIANVTDEHGIPTGESEAFGVANQTVYFYVAGTVGRRFKPYFKHVALKTDDYGEVKTHYTNGIAVGSEHITVSLFPKNSENQNVVSLKVPFTVTPARYGQAWAQIGITLGLSTVCVLLSFVLASYIMKQDIGTKAMQNVANPIKEGAQGFLRTQYITIAVIAIPVTLILFALYFARQKSDSDPRIPQIVLALIVAVSFLIGAALSALSGFIGMFVSVRANVRVTAAATKSYPHALNIAMRSGAFAGFLVVALSVFGVCGLFALLYVAIPQEKADATQIVSMIVGFSFGCSLSALFAQLGGGIFTKAADVGADLVGKVEKDIPEDDVRNPAVIADLVGDNVGDCAGRGADLFESISAENIGVMILAGTLASNAYPQISTPISYIVFPLVVHVCGMIGTWIGIFFVRVREVRDTARNHDEYRLFDEEQRSDSHHDEENHIGSPYTTTIHSDEIEPDLHHLSSEDLDDPMMALNRGYAVSTVITTGLFIAVCYWMLYTPHYPDAWWKYCICGLVGIVTSYAFVFITIYYTDNKWRPVLSIVEASKTGAATNVISGIAVGLESTSLPVIVISIAILASYYIGKTTGITSEDGKKIGGLFGTAVATIGMLSTSSYILAMDTLGPIVDNAGGIAELSQMPASIRMITDKLDAVGNTTKALTKGYAIGSASLAAFLLFTAFLDTVTVYTGKEFNVVNLATPEVFVGGLCGAGLVFLFTSLTIRAVGNSAQTVIQEVRRQFREKPGIMNMTEKPDYDKCVAIVTRSALIQMILPGLIAVLTPVKIGFIFRFIGKYTDVPNLGAEVSAGFLMIATITGILMALFLNNAGGAWDNAKKTCEMDSRYGGKGSEIHKATVIGDTIGDPFKDTAGPSIHCLIKLLATIVLVLAPLFVGSNINSAV